jgi:hypothetical protein
MNKAMNADIRHLSIIYKIGLQSRIRINYLVKSIFGKPFPNHDAQRVAAEASRRIDICFEGLCDVL